MSDRLTSPLRAVVGHPHRHHLYETAQAWSESAELEAFVTERFLPEGVLTRLLRPALGLSRRLRKATSYSRAAISSKVVIAQPRAWKRGVFSALGAKTTSKRWTDAVVEAARHADVVHLPCAGALDVFRALQGSGKRLYLEQYVGDRRAGRDALMREAHALGVEDRSYETGGYDWERIERNEAEYALADVIVAGSRFVRDTLLAAGVPESKIVVCQYGCDITTFPYVERRRSAGETLHVALIGTGAVRKGILRLLRAARGLAKVRVHVFGLTHDLPGGPAAWHDVAQFHGHLPRPEVAAALRDCHVFAMPSVWEGSSYAVGEAMAAGLPVIVTPNSGSTAVDGRDGFIVPVGDEAALRDALERMKDEPLRRTLAERARRTAEGQTWANYREDLGAVIRAQSAR